MHIVVDAAALAEAAPSVARVIPNRPSTPILAGMLIETGSGGVSLSGFDYESSVRITVPAEIQRPGSALVPGRLLAEIAGAFPPGPISIIAGANEVELSGEGTTFVLQTLPVADYPALPETPPVAGTIDLAEFDRAAHQAVIAAGRDELLPIFTGVLLDIDGAELTLMATDRYRMAVRSLDWEPADDQAKARLLVPARGLAAVTRGLLPGSRIELGFDPDPTGVPTISFSGRSRTGEVRQTSRLIDGAYPDFGPLLLVEPDTTVRVAVPALREAVRRAALVLERNTPLRLSFEDQQCGLTAASSTAGRSSITLPTVNEFLAPERVDLAGFNPGYLIDALSVIDTPYVELAITERQRQCLVTGLSELEGNPDVAYRHLIKTLRLAD
ncbi:DNA polymerase III subunit beta [Microlunatus speluncae]|uniref:DNA polymerase III subunit beta n=1 Tax=Microlunatus speluncae TaxID=2594267 RepID=UPI00126638F2|nr:DNA polymerase III subunit beta [Microlunatus speluncae]